MLVYNSDQTTLPEIPLQINTILRTVVPIINEIVALGILHHFHFIFNTFFGLSLEVFA